MRTCSNNPLPHPRVTNIEIRDLEIEMSIELKPCPFCGSKAHFDIDDENWEWIECESCCMQGNRSASLMEDCKPKLAEEWNRRSGASLADAQAEISRLRGAFSSLLEMVEQHADFANGVTDPTGTIDEGRVIAAEQLRKFQEVLK